MNALAREVWRRLCLGTGTLLHGLGYALSPGGCGPLLLRCGGALVSLLFAARLLERAPQLAYAVPLVWLVASWAVSDSSATPPPLPPEGADDVSAGGVERIDRVEYDPSGVRCTIHVVREEVNEA